MSYYVQRRIYKQGFSDVVLTVTILIIRLLAQYHVCRHVNVSRYLICLDVSRVFVVLFLDRFAFMDISAFFREGEMVHCV